MIPVKDANVNTRNLSAAAGVALGAAIVLYGIVAGKQAVITSAQDNVHGKNSKHEEDELDKECNALDLKTNGAGRRRPGSRPYLTPSQRDQICAELTRHLGEHGFQVILEYRNQEREHIHIEYDEEQTGRSLFAAPAIKKGSAA